MIRIIKEINIIFSQTSLKLARLAVTEQSEDVTGTAIDLNNFLRLAVNGNSRVDVDGIVAAKRVVVATSQGKSVLEGLLLLLIIGRGHCLGSSWVSLWGFSFFSLLVVHLVFLFYF